MFTNTLSGDAQKALAILGEGKILPDKTYLAGGSSLALQFGHRISVDFDFFTPSSFVGEQIQKNLEKAGRFVFQEADEKDTLLGVFNKVKFSLFRYPYQLIFPSTIFLGVSLANPKDIAAMKLAAIMDRGTKKDFIDLFFLIKKGISIENSFDYYDKKYKALANNVYSLVTSLSYFVDAEKTKIPEMIEKVDWEEVKEFFRKETIRLADKYI